jgi:hypothetical protein
MKKLYSLILLGLFSFSVMGQSIQDVTFKVDMNNYKGTYNKVYVNGNFNGWCGSCNEMTDSDKDGIYEVTINIKANDIEYKFTLDGYSDQESLSAGTTCTKTTSGYTNRFIKLNGNVVIDAVCWNSCIACNKVDVTFNCNMQQYNKPFTDLYVAGTFNGWSGNANKMTDPDGDKIYSTTLSLRYDSIEYIFEVDNWKDTEKLTPGSTCVKNINGNTNRFVNLTKITRKTLSNVCWASCSDRDVTFKVDMNNYKGTYNKVYVNGNFNGWCGSCNEMTDSDKDGIYEVKLPLTQDSIEYKFTLDGWKNQEMLNPNLPCVITKNSLTNRFLKFNAPTLLNAICYDSCVSCVSTSGLIKANITSMNLYPNPSQGFINLAMGLAQKETMYVIIYDIQGHKLYSKIYTGVDLNESIDMSNHANGVYMISVTTSKGSKRMVFLLNK